MATTTSPSFDLMLKKYMPYELLREEIIKRDYFLQRVDKDQKWKGGEMQVPFKAGSARSLRYGKLVKESNITKRTHQLGIVSGYKEIWGAMKFEDSDLARHGDMEQSFIKILPEQIEEFLADMKEAVSGAFLNGSHIDAHNAAGLNNNLVGGIAEVFRPERFTIGQLVETTSYVGLLKVVSIDMETKTLALVDSVTSAVVDLSAVFVAGEKFYYEGGKVAADTFTSLPDQLLSAANGGSANLFGIQKTLYPHLQAIQHDGSSLNAVNFLEKLFDFQIETKVRGKGNPTEIIMSERNFAIAAKILSGNSIVKAADLAGAAADSISSRGTVFTTEQTKASAYGWSEITVGSARGQLKLVGVNEMDDDKMFVMDWGALKMHSNGMFERRTSPEGRQFYEVRTENGYSYIVDIRFFGELVVSKPSHCGIVHSVPVL